MVSTNSRVQYAEPKCSAFATPRTKQTIVHAARPAASCSPIEPLAASFEKIGRGRLMISRMHSYELLKRVPDGSLRTRLAQAEACATKNERRRGMSAAGVF